MSDDTIFQRPGFIIERSSDRSGFTAAHAESALTRFWFATLPEAYAWCDGQIADAIAKGMTLG